MTTKVTLVDALTALLGIMLSIELLSCPGKIEVVFYITFVSN